MPGQLACKAFCQLPTAFVTTPQILKCAQMRIHISIELINRTDSQRKFTTGILQPNQCKIRSEVYQNLATLPLIFSLSWMVENCTQEIIYGVLLPTRASEAESEKEEFVTELTSFPEAF
uniref:Uncharacterized protein n=1 Tax=Ascaris lumbricoides TaxID=6252 RepID=A0A0M3IA97_ASCLU